MRNFHSTFSFSPVAIFGGVTAILFVVYIGLIAVVMSYAALTIEFSQSVKTGESSVAALEKQYLAGVARTTAMDYESAGYVLPSVKTFVREKSVTARR